MLDHVGKRAKAPVSFPVIGKIDQITGPFSKCLEAVLPDTAHELIWVLNAQMDRKRPALIDIQRYKLHHEELVRLPLRFDARAGPRCFPLLEDWVEQVLCV